MSKCHENRRKRRVRAKRERNRILEQKHIELLKSKKANKGK